MNLVLLGSGAFGLPTYQRLAEKHTISLVVTQPDRPAGRGRALTPTPVGAWAEDAGLPLLKAENVSKNDITQVRAAKADAWVVIAFGQKLSENLLADRFAINLHASLLPRWRGAAPINHAILAGDTQTGNSVITLAQRMDAGLVLGQSTRTIEPDQTIGQLHDLLAEDGPDLVERVLHEHQTGTLSPIEQNESLVTLAGKLDKKRDGWIDFTEDANTCRCRINGLSPWPAVTATFRTEHLKLLRAEPSDTKHESTTEPGEILDATTGTVACADGTIRILEAQAPGKPAMDWPRLAQSLKIQSGDRLEGTRPC